MSRIHPFALVSPQAEIGSEVAIGPFSVIEAGATIGDRCNLAGRVTIKAGTILGPENEIHEGAVLGGKPQHLKAGDQLGDLRIGCGNVIRENVTIHRGLTPETHTVIGDHNLIMVNAHIAHDCHVGNRVVIVNNVLLAGHVHVGDRAYLSGAAAVHQFCRIGAYAMVGGQAHLSQDVPPFVTLDGKTTTVVGLNIIGLRRAGFCETDLAQLKRAYRLIYRSGMTWSETLRALSESFKEGPASQFLPFLSESKRGFVHERRTPRGATIAYGPLERGDEPSKPAIAEIRRAG
jgi:UDP-N-acetylglucosamine acyltransferase